MSTDGAEHRFCSLTNRSPYVLEHERLWECNAILNAMQYLIPTDVLELNALPHPRSDDDTELVLAIRVLDRLRGCRARASRGVRH